MTLPDRELSRVLVMAWLLTAASVAHAQAPVRTTTGRAPTVRALEVEGHEPAAFVAPSGDAARPLVIALHGNFDRPEWMCAAFGEIVGDRAFVLCPRGLPRTDAPGQDRWSLPPMRALQREIRAARAALAARFPGRIVEGAEVWIGFSQGAHRVASMAVAQPSAYERILLVEGGRALWRVAGARRYAPADARVAFVCAMRWCEQRGERTRRTLERGRARSRLERIAAAHHDLQTMRPAIVRSFDWLVEGDPRFAR